MSHPSAKHDDRATAKLWDEQEQARIDELSSSPILDRPFATKSKGKTKRLLSLLDSLQQGGKH
jgi:hypothetical protein